VGQQPACRLDFLALAPGELGWLAGAKLARSRLPQIPTRYYDAKVTYGSRWDEAKFEEAYATFPECTQLIATIAALTDAPPQGAWGARRVATRRGRYPPRETTAGGRPSCFPGRKRWGPQAPARGNQNLFDGRYRVLEEFKRRGIDVSSEALRYAFIGRVSLF